MFQNESPQIDAWHRLRKVRLAMKQTFSSEQWKKKIKFHKFSIAIFWLILQKNYNGIYLVY